jgi:hypothetical protein
MYSTEIPILAGGEGPLASDIRAPLEPVGAARQGGVAVCPDLDAVAVAGATAQFSGVTVHTLAVDAKVWTELGYPVVSGHGSQEVRHFVVDVMAYTPDATIEQTADGRTVLVRRGCGFRAVLAAWSQEVELSADLRQVAATAKFKSVHTQLRARVIGIENAGLSSLSLFTGSTFDAEIFAEFGRAAYVLSGLLARAEGRAKLTPLRIRMSVIGGPAYTTRNVAWSSHIALEGIRHGRPLSAQLEACLKKYPERVIVSVVGDVYRRFGVRGDDRPSADQENRAWHFLQKGR